MLLCDDKGLCAGGKRYPMVFIGNSGDIGIEFSPDIYGVIILLWALAYVPTEFNPNFIFYESIYILLQLFKTYIGS